MRYFLWAILVFLAFFLQGRVSFLGIPPDITVLLAYYAGIRYGETRGMFSGVLIGVLEDGISSSIIGPNMLSKGIVGFSSSFFISGGVFRWTPLLGTIALALLTLLDNSVIFLSKSVFDKMPTVPSAALFIAVMQAVMNAFAGLFIRPKHVD